MASRKKAHGAQVKSGMMGLALLGTGVYEFLENLENGDNTLLAAGKAMKNTKVRGKAIRKASREAAAEIAQDGDES
jgi:hypothetical protein